jgi:T3SS (YopN, CesT) and YbjN peptide-binding chaperone 1
METQSKSPMSFHEVRELVQRELTELVGRIELDRDGDFSFTYDSARVFVSIRSHELKKGVQSTLVRVFSITNVDVPVSAELYRYIALQSADYLFGSLGAIEDDSTARIIFKHTLLGDYLDPDEIAAAVMLVAFAADDVDDEIMKMFGGTRFTDS